MFGDIELSAGQSRVSEERSAGAPLPQFIFNLEEKSSR